MNEEENDIRYFTNLIEDNKTHKYDYRKYYTPIFDKRLENILNLINKLQKENQKLKKQSELSANAFEKNTILKDKIIDLMAEDIAKISEPKVSKEAIRDSYYKKVEEENE